MANNTDEMRQYREAFSLFDKDHDDIIAPQELGTRIDEHEEDSFCLS